MFHVFRAPTKASTIKYSLAAAYVQSRGKYTPEFGLQWQFFGDLGRFPYPKCNRVSEQKHAAYPPEDELCPGGEPEIPADEMNRGIQQGGNTKYYFLIALQVLDEIKWCLLSDWSSNVARLVDPTEARHDRTDYDSKGRQFQCRDGKTLCRPTQALKKHQPLSVLVHVRL
ncbi:hypothetical protein CBS147323_5582 [Aspergillus niger]|nr:hypothetical protein CBS147323_5582 [Aspergillus niger]KAI3005499.1 hypothetical protein CBS147345_7570 [Aspergillus niger]KAI3019634.1 hypothetical protein CBS147347_8929 [Aspergillus niger]